MSERIERWANVYSDGSLGTFWDSPPPTLPHARVAHFVELRDGESITVNLGLESRPPLIPNDELRDRVAAAVRANDVVNPVGEQTRTQIALWSLVDDARKERDAAIERAEKAEREYADLKASYDSVAALGLRAQDRALSAESQLNDAAAKFERWAAVRLWAADISHAPGAPMSRAIKSAADLRSHYFPPAKEV